MTHGRLSGPCIVQQIDFVLVILSDDGNCYYSTLAGLAVPYCFVCLFVLRRFCMQQNAWHMWGSPAITQILVHVTHQESLSSH